MSLDKAIAHGKEHRKPYYGSQRVDASCRPHGACEWCRSNRLHARRKREELARLQMEDMRKVPEQA
jgi:hypothetical protein